MINDSEQNAAGEINFAPDATPHPFLAQQTEYAPGAELYEVLSMVAAGYYGISPLPISMPCADTQLPADFDDLLSKPQATQLPEAAPRHWLRHLVLNIVSGLRDFWATHDV